MNEQPVDKGWAPERSFEEIHNIAFQLFRRRSPVIKKMEEVNQSYNGDVIVPNPDVANEPDMPNLTPSLVTDVVDGLAMRAASVHPMTFCAAVDPYKETGRRSVGYAKDRSRVLSATYQESKWKVGRRRAFRHLNAYETMSLFIEPDFRDGMPKLRVRDPLRTYPEEQALENSEPPSYVAFITRYSGDYLRARFPQVQAERGGPITDRETHELWDVFEWVDHDQISFGLLGPRLMDGYHIAQGYDMFAGPWMPLGRPMRNRAGRCLAITPQAVTLHSIGNRLNALLENAKWQNKLMALDILAQEKAIFPDMFVLGDGGMSPRLQGGQWFDGREGKMNVVESARTIGTLSQQPDQRTSQSIDRLERNFRVSAGLSPMMGGETPGAALRTGRALGQMAEIAIDPRIQELHEVDEVWMPHVNEAILEAYKGWWGSKEFHFISGWDGDKGEVKFKPEELIETTKNTVTYAIPGADIMQATQVLGSLHGAEMISTETAQRMHPWIRDPYKEITVINDEKLEKAAIDGMMQQVLSGQMPMSVFAKIREKMRDGDMDVFKATIAVDEEIREQQMAAEEAALAQQQMAPDPMAQLGLAAGPAAAAPAAPVASPTPASSMAGVPVEQMRALMQGAVGAPQA